MKIWTTTVSDGDGEVVTHVFATELEAWTSVKTNHMDPGDPDFDVNDPDDRDDMVEWLYEVPGLSVFVEEHEVTAIKRTEIKDLRN